MKLEKYIQKAGITSRRKASDIIESGRVRVNGKIIKEFWAQVDEKNDRIEVDETPILIEKKEYYLFNKPRGYITSLKDPYKSRTIMDFLNKYHDIDVRVHPVGRLDKDTEGLLILTNDGDLTYKILHPKMKVEKEYLARVSGIPDDEDVELFSKGFQLKNFYASPAKLFIDKKEKDASWIRIIIKEGKKRQVRRMCSFIGHKVLYLKRIRVGTFTLEGIEKIGSLKRLSKDEIEKFIKDNGI
ncbi:MAG TPA: pseudouridine synthase [Thermotogota bacterium]|nr:pseudouridine synthase [Thermotogota bacterium]HPJ87529.1 pseudouridine synthase [Thermotogota bacterium]HPR94734.1 pseudouridine synthase [Thermotogota bacterium]